MCCIKCMKQMCRYNFIVSAYCETTCVWVISLFLIIGTYFYLHLMLIGFQMELHQITCKILQSNNDIEQSYTKIQIERVEIKKEREKVLSIDRQPQR